MFRYLFLLSIVLSFSCSKEPDLTLEESNNESETAEKALTEETTDQNTVKEEFNVDKLSTKEKLQIILEAKAKNPREQAFIEVSNFLDYGDTFAYLNFEEDKQEFITDSRRIIDFIKTQPESKSENFDQISALVHVVTSLGLWEPDAVGLSHKRIDKDFIRNKFCIHFKNSNSKKYFWNCFDKPQKFDILKLLPENTLFSAGFRVNQQAVLDMMSFIYLQMPRMDSTPEELEELKKSAETIKSFNAILDNEAGIAVYHGSGTVTVDFVKVPAFTGCLYFKLKEGVSIEKIQENTQMMNLINYLKTIEKIRVEIKDGYLFIFLNEESKKIFDESKISFTEDKHFKAVKDLLPEKFNYYAYLNPSVTQLIYESMLSQLGEALPGLEEIIETFLPQEKFMYSFLNVMEMKDNGIYMTAVSDGNSTAFLIVQAVMLNINIALFMPEVEYAEMFAKTAEEGKSFNAAEILNSLDVTSLLNEAQEVKPPPAKKFSTKDTLEDLEFIRYALFQYAKSNNGFFPEPDGSEGLSQLVTKRLLKKAEYVLSDMDNERELPKDKNFTDEETSYLYLGAKVKGTVSGYYYPLVITKPGVLNDGFMVLFANKEIKYFKSGGKSLASMLKTINKRYEFNDRQKEIIIKKIKNLE